MDLYSAARVLLDVAADALMDTYGGTPDRRFVVAGLPVHDVPNQLTVSLPGINQNAQLSTEDGTIIGWDINYSLQITRPYVYQPGDAGVVEAEDIDANTKILMEDLDALLDSFQCQAPLGAQIGNITALEPLGGVAGWSIDLVVRGV